MGIKLLSSIVLALTVISFPLWADGQNLGSKSGNLGQKVGHSKRVTNNKTQPNKIAGKNVDSNTGQARKFDNNFNKGRNVRHDSGDKKDRWHGGKDKRHGKHHHRKGHHKFNPLFAPYYYFGYYGYAPYANYYVYADSDYPFGYGTTLGTTLERPSNLEVNQFGQDSPVPAEYQRDNSDAGYVNTDSPEKDVADYYNPPPAEEQTIYVWVDESGVRNYANDLDLVPLGYRDIVTTFGAE